jgi:hypothetical protein
MQIAPPMPVSLEELAVEVRHDDIPARIFPAASKSDAVRMEKITDRATCKANASAGM